mgnify:CR=1 FL=1
MSDKQPVKLNLGCGDRKMYGFVNVDLREDLNPDVICDVTKIHEKFKDVDLIVLGVSSKGVEWVSEQLKTKIVLRTLYTATFLGRETPKSRSYTQLIG